MNLDFNIKIDYNKACGLAKVGRNEEALSILAQVLKSNPDYAKAYLKRSDILLAEKRFDEAIGDLNKVK